MSAQRLRTLLFSLITVIGVYTPWITWKGAAKDIVEASGVKISTDVRHFFFGIIVLIAILAFTGNKSKPFGIVKKIFIALFSFIIWGLAVKYIGDTSTEISGPGFGLYIMLAGGLLIMISPFIPEKVSCFLHKFIGGSKEETPEQTEQQE